MAYKQPYGNTSKNDGASEPISALLAIGGKLALKAAAKFAAKGAGKALAKKGAQVVVKKAAQATGKRLVQEGGKKVIGQVVKKGAVNAAQSAMPALQTNVTSSVAKSATKKGLGKAVTKAGEIGKSAISKGKEVVQKGKDIYDKGVEKVADATGFDQDAIKETASNLKDSARDSVDQGLSKRKEDIEAASQKGTIDPLPSSRAVHDAEGSYANPSTTGASMCNHGASMCKHGPSYPPVNTTNMNTNNPAKVNNNQWASLNDNLFKGTDQTFASYSAPVTIKGITFDAADAVRLGIMGYKAVDKAVKKRKAAKTPVVKAKAPVSPAVTNIVKQNVTTPKLNLNISSKKSTPSISSDIYSKTYFQDQTSKLFKDKFNMKKTLTFQNKK